MPRPRLAISVFAASLLLACGALHSVAPFWGTGEIAEKFQYFSARKDEFDTLFIGSSRVNSQIDPKRFDEVTAAHGAPAAASFNFGIDAMFAPEDEFVCEQILAMRPARLRTVFIEVGTFVPVVAPVPALRLVYYHDIKRTLLKCRMTLADERVKLGLKPPGNKARLSFRSLFEQARLFTAASGLLWTEASLFLQREANFGRGAALLEAAGVSPPEPPSTSEIKILPSGFMPLPRGTERFHARVIDLFRTELAKILLRPPKPLLLTEPEEENLRRIVEAVRAAGAEPVLLISPFPYPKTYYPRNAGAPVLDYSSPYLWPDLYREEERRDQVHLNPKGAERYTQTVAECWLGLRSTGSATVAK